MQNRISLNTRSDHRRGGFTLSDRAGAAAAAACCGLILLTGFFFAGRQHFSSMDYGIRNSRLRKQLDDLRAEKQRLLYTKEVSLSPIEIKKAAKKSGMFEKNGMPAAPVAELASTRKNKDLPASIAAVSKPVIIKTGSVIPISSRIERPVEVAARNEKIEKRSLVR
jgi:hypothetical protein